MSYTQLRNLFHIVLKSPLVIMIFSSSIAILSCDFEREPCGLITQDPSPSDDFDWVYGNGPTEAEFTGPFADNTFKNETGKAVTTVYYHRQI